MQKQSLSERDICTKYITPAVQSAGWNLHTQVREEVSFTRGRVIVKRRSTIVPTNKPLAALGQVLHDADLAEAILDRLLERGTHYTLRGRSYRTRHHKEELNPPEKEAV